MTRALMGVALLMAAGCAEAPMMQPTPVIATVVCTDCRSIYVTVYGVVTVGQPAQPIKARVVVDGVEHHTQPDGTVPLVVTPTTVIQQIVISAWGLGTVILHPQGPLADQYVVLR